MRDDGVHIRTPGEYVRPAGTLNLTSVAGSVRTILVVGTTFYQDALARFADAERLPVELVPEPCNPWDGWAVACDIDRVRVGYLSSGSAALWHDIVRAYSRSGLAVTLDGIVRVTSWNGETGLVAVEIATPEWSDVDDMAVLVGLRKQHDAVLSQLSADVRSDLLAECWNGLSKSSAKQLKRHRSLAPGLTWLKDDDRPLRERVPRWHISFLRNEVMEARRSAAIAAAHERQLRREAKLREKERAKAEVAARFAQKRAHAVAAVTLQAAGRSHAQIADELALDLASIPALLSLGRRESPTEAVDWHARERDDRILRARQALALQRAGSSRAAIAEQLGCSLESVKQLLPDARFYEDQTVDSARASLAEVCADLSAQGLTKSEVLAAMNVSRAAGLRAYRDAAVLKALA